MTIDQYLMLGFVLAYSMVVLLRNVDNKFSEYLKNIIYMSSGLLLVYYTFDLKSLLAFKQYEYIAGFLVALTFKDLLPVLVDFIIEVVTAKLYGIKLKMIGELKISKIKQR